MTREQLGSDRSDRYIELAEPAAGRGWTRRTYGTMHKATVLADGGHLDLVQN